MASIMKNPVYEFTLIGDTPLLMHRDDVLASDTLTAARKSMKKGDSVPGDDRSPAWTWTTYLYHDEVNLTCPFPNVLKALSWGGSRVTFKKMTTFKAKTQSGIVPCTEHFEFRYGEKSRQCSFIALEKLKTLPFGAMAQKVKEEFGFALDVRRAPIGTKKHVRVRPRFDSWTVKGRVEVTDTDITADALQDIFLAAGQGGLMDWRPSSPKSPGRYGKFHAEVREV